MDTMKTTPTGKNDDPVGYNEKGGRQSVLSLMLSQRIKMAVDNLFVTAGLSIRAATPGEPLLYKKASSGQHLLLLFSSSDLFQTPSDYYNSKISFAHTSQSTQDGHCRFRDGEK